MPSVAENSTYPIAFDKISEDLGGVARQALAPIMIDVVSGTTSTEHVEHDDTTATARHFSPNFILEAGVRSSMRKERDLVELLANASLYAGKKWRTAIASLFIELTAIASSDVSTRYLEPNLIGIQRAILRRRRVSVSSAHRMSRKALKSGSFAAPSGVYLNWLQMLRDEGEEIE